MSLAGGESQVYNLCGVAEIMWVVSVTWDEVWMVAELRGEWCCRPQFLRGFDVARLCDCQRWRVDDDASGCKIISSISSFSLHSTSLLHVAQSFWKSYLSSPLLVSSDRDVTALATPPSCWTELLTRQVLQMFRAGNVLSGEDQCVEVEKLTSSVEQVLQVMFVMFRAAAAGSVSDKPDLCVMKSISKRQRETDLHVITSSRLFLQRSSSRVCPGEMWRWHQNQMFLSLYVHTVWT